MHEAELINRSIGVLFLWVFPGVILLITLLYGLSLWRDRRRQDQDP